MPFLPSTFRYCFGQILTTFKCVRTERITLELGSVSRNHCIAPWSRLSDLECRWYDSREGCFASKISLSSLQRCRSESGERTSPGCKSQCLWIKLLALVCNVVGNEYQVRVVPTSPPTSMKGVGELCVMYECHLICIRPISNTFTIFVCFAISPGDAMTIEISEHVRQCYFIFGPRR